MRILKKIYQNNYKKSRNSNKHCDLQRKKIQIIKKLLNSLVLKISKTIRMTII